MKKTLIAASLLAASFSAPAQSRLSTHELSINAFRNPSIGLEYRYKHLSVHAGYYPTNFTSGVTTEFIRTGVTLWFLPVGKRENPSSFYTSVSYARGLTREYKEKNAVMPEVGFRWMIYKGLNFRIGVTGLAAPGESFKVNPTPGLSYSFFF
ncbi:hypothetical protein [Persicitalea sp.]|uniref:hypothetical protein n=1 Tax=Persicitalea sp. TaxID=3100273 RepID=UPI003593A0A3